MKDGLGREIDYLRISITDRCNLRCIYCMPEKGIPLVEHSSILSVDETVQLTKIITRVAGIKKIRITGGEPLVRKGIQKIIREISKLPVDEVVLTTNGIPLPSMSESLKISGVTRVNISVDSLRDKVLRNITRREITLSNIQSAVNAAKSSGMTPVKINCVVLRSMNLTEIPDFLEWGASMGVNVRFIEHMPVCLPETEFVSKEEMLKSIDTLGGAYTSIESNGTAELYKMDDSGQIFGIIAPITGDMCADCRRLRLTARGKLLSCLAYKPTADLKNMLRNNKSEDEIENTIRNAIESKPASHDGCGRIKMWKVGG